LEYSLPFNRQNGWWERNHKSDIKKFERWIEIHNEKEIQKTTQKVAEEMNKLFNS
jgi:thiaminase